MEYLPDPNYRRLMWGVLYLAGVLVMCTGLSLNKRSSDSTSWKSFVSKYGKEYPSLNNKLTVDGFVGRGRGDSLKHIEDEFNKLDADVAIMTDMLSELGDAAGPALKTIGDVDDYLGRWRAILYLLQKVHDNEGDGLLPIEDMRKVASGQMKVLFSDAAHEMPNLLHRIDSQIRNNDSPNGSCLLCKFVTKKIEAMNSRSESETIDLKMAVNETQEFLGQLMKLQVRGALLYDMTCSSEDIACRQKIVTLERTLQFQNQRLSNCTPMLMKTLAHSPSARDLYFVNLLSDEIMYIPESESLSSQRGKLDMTRVHVRACAMKCAQKRWNMRDPSLWTLEDASPHGKLGYFIRGRNGCYVGFDRSFLSFVNTQLNDPKAAGAENDEVLLCRPDPVPNRQTQTFTIEPVWANHSSTYKLRNVLTGKYLRSIRTNELITDDATGGHVVNLVLQPCDINQLGCKWGISTELPVCEVRETYKFMDMFILKLYLLLMGILFIMLIASLVVIWLYRKPIRRDYLQYRRVHTQEIVIPPSYRFPSRT